MRMNWLLELGGIALVAAAAWRKMKVGSTF
jgi:hypothetical protein